MSNDLAMEILRHEQKIGFTLDELQKYKSSVAYYYENKTKYYLLYNSSILGFFFKRQAEKFRQETSFFFEVNERKRMHKLYQIAQKIALKDYEINHLSHYVFDIDGECEKYGHLEIPEEVFKAAKILRHKYKYQKMNEVKPQIPIIARKENVVHVNFRR